LNSLIVLSASNPSTFWAQNMKIHMYHSVNVEILSIIPNQGEGFQGGHEVVISGQNMVPGLGESQKIRKRIFNSSFPNFALLYSKFLLTVSIQGTVLARFQIDQDQYETECTFIQPYHNIS